MSKIISDKSKYVEYDKTISKIVKNIKKTETEKMNKINHKSESNAIAYIEENYPETAKEFQKLQYEQWELFCKKQMDYGPSNIAMGTDLVTDEQKRLSKIGLIVRINDKVQRLINLVVNNNREAQNEPTIDAFKDLACYGIIAQIVQNGKWGK